MKKVFIFGSLNMDLVISSPREVLQGETIHGEGFMTNGGGKGANQATACGKLGAKAFMGGCVGNDGFGQTLVSNLEKYGVDTSCVRAVDGVSTGVAVILIVNHDNRIILDSGANGVAGKEDVDRLLSLAEPGDYLLTQLENRIETVGYALEAAKK
ncbi:MAG: ribokinase, partial [Clostridiales bacterium]|nr:ribokinase [Clostridiales bacterium]